MSFYQIKVGRCHYALVDEADFNLVSQFKWNLHTSRKYKYAWRVYIENGKRRAKKMHREIMGAAKGEDVDHINGNGLDNRRCNLRRCTRSQNMMNAQRKMCGASGFKGVAKNGKAWRCRITKDYKTITIGNFNSPEEAAAAYNKVAKELFGEFARFNEVPCQKNHQN